MRMLNSLDSLLSKLGKKYALPILLACSPLLPSEVHAAPPPSKPALCTTIQQCFDQGTEFYEAGKYQEALLLFQESYKRTKDRKNRATLLKNIATAYASLREPAEAKIYLSLYLAENPADAKRENLESVVEALSSYAQGRELFRKGDYQAAVEVFRKVYGSVVKTRNLRTVLLYEQAQCYENMGKPDLAIEYYNLYLADAGKKAQDRVAVEEKIARLKKVVTAQPVAALPFPSPSPSPKQQEATPTIVQPALVYAQPTPERSYFQQHSWSTTTGAISAAALLSGAAFGYLARSKFNDLKDACGDTGCQENDIQTVASRSKVANGLFIGGGVMGAAAISLYIWESYRESAAQKAPKKWNGTSPRALSFTPTGLEVKF